MTALSGVLFLAAYSSRSQAYAQAMAVRGLEPEHMILFGDPAKDKGLAPPEKPEPIEGVDIFLPDLGESVGETCERMAWPVNRLAVDSVNDAAIAQALKERKPALVIYSGYGGQLVKSEILDLGFPFLHLHSGWLPDFRGSTTFYYSFLTERRCAVTAFFMDADIDSGPIVTRQHYPTPPAGMDVDNLYDGAIRADLLVRVLEKFSAQGMPETEPPEGKGTTYYIIHPVLKHLSLLSLEPGA